MALPGVWQQVCALQTSQSVQGREKASQSVSKEGRGWDEKGVLHAMGQTGVSSSECYKIYWHKCFFFPLRALKVCKSKEDLTIERTGKMSQANIDRK